MRRTLVAALATFLIAGWVAADALQVSFNGNSVVANGITPGGQVAWFSVAQRSATFLAFDVPKAAISVDSEWQGRAQIDVEGGVPPRSIWVAVDLQTGQWGMGTPHGYPLRQLAIGREILSGGGANAPDRLNYRGHFLFVFVARPGSGAWTATLWDGSREDLDGPANNSITIAISALSAIGASPPAPAALGASDVVALIDPDPMAIAVILPGATPTAKGGE